MSEAVSHIAALAGLAASPGADVVMSMEAGGTGDVAAGEVPTVAPQLGFTGSESVASTAAETAGTVASDAAAAGSSGPSFIVSEGGTAFPVPKGATGPFPAESGKGFQFTGGSGGNGLSPKATDFRFMDPVTTGSYQFPGGYGSYGNAAGQTNNPLTGQTIAPSNPLWHIPAR